MQTLESGQIEKVEPRETRITIAQHFNWFSTKESRKFMGKKYLKHFNN